MRTMKVLKTTIRPLGHRGLCARLMPRGQAAPHQRPSKFVLWLLLALSLSVVHCPLSIAQPIAQSIAQSPAREVFLAAPDTIFPLLTAVNRADFVDFLESKMRAEVTNRLEGRSEMTRLTDDYIHIRMTKATTWEMKVLALTDSTAVVCTVSTACGPACDSHVQFYTTDWQPLPTTTFLPARPTMAEFIAPLPADTLASAAYLEARAQADVTLIRADLSATEPTLTLTLTTPDYMSGDAADLIRPQLLPARVYTWRDGRFVP